MNIKKIQEAKYNQILELISQRGGFASDNPQYKLITERIHYNSGYFDALYDIEVKLIDLIWEMK